MPITKEEFEKLPETTLHGKYVKRINEIGKELGFKVKGLKTELGILDCVWRLDNKKLHTLDSIPIVTFEVICSEKQKALRGSLLNMIAMKPALAVFVLVSDGIKESASNIEPDKWLKRIQTFVSKLRSEFKGIVRIEIWDDKYVDGIYYKIIESKVPSGKSPFHS